MRIILGVVVAALLGFGGYWWAVARTVDRQLAGAGPISAAGVQITGFPTRFEVQATDLRLRGRDGLSDWQVPTITVTTPSARPTRFDLRLADRQTFTLSGQRMTLEGQNTQARITTRIGLPPVLTGVEGSIDAPRLVLGDPALGLMLRADGARLVAPGDGQTFALDMQVTGATLPAPVLRVLDPANVLPPAIALVALDGQVQLDAPLSPGTPAPSVAALDLSRIALDWGAVQVTGSAQLRADGPGTLGGQITLHLQGWPLVLDALARLGIVPQDQMQMVRMLAASMVDPQTRALVLPLSVAASRIALGPIPLGRLPRF